MARLLQFAAVALASLECIGPALSQEWPTRAMTMIVPFSAGGPAENVGGSGGMTGSSRVAKAAPDGYQFVLGNVGTHAANQTFYKTPLYNAATDFAPVMLIAQTPLVLLA